MKNFVRSMKQSRSQRKSGCGRNRMRGGTGGFSYTTGPPISNYAPSAAEIIRSPSCGDVNRGEDVNSMKGHGLPGMNGGRYTTEFEVVGSAGIPVRNVLSIPCDRAVSNTYNMVGPDRVTAPTAQAPLPYPGSLKGGKRYSRSKKMKKYKKGGANSSPFLISPRAGYTTWPSDMTGDEGGTLAGGKTPFLLTVPYSSTPVAMKQSGGKKRKTRKARKVRKTKKTRKH
jgi:hypothetical protein